ncbi:hypothetical protein DV737_g817, partial [Chaetothyriales sp. CBS 132003]
MPGGANDTELFWQLLVQGRDVHTTVPPDRFDLDAHFDPTGKLENSTDTPYGNFIDHPGQFDPGFFNMSPRENRNAGLVFETTPWLKQEGKKRYAIVNSFGAHGGNTTLLLEDAPEKLTAKTTLSDHIKTHIIAISAKSKASLRGNIEDLLAYLDQATPENNLLGNISYTLVARRIHHSRRIAASVSNIDQLREFLKSSLETSDDSIWADMALTIGKHLYKRLNPGAEEVDMNISNVEVLESQIPHNYNSVNVKPQLIQVEGDIDLAEASTEISWYTLTADGNRSDHAFASATVYYEDAKVWQAQMVYQLFQNVVDYADRYQGMQSVVLHGLEAFAEVELVADHHGSWHTPPHWIDSVFQMAGFVMNSSDITNTREFFYITPGWQELRLAKPLEAGQSYQSYVHMFPSEEEPNTFLGDIYALQAGNIVGVCEGIKFRKIPRVLMSHLFSGGSKQPQPSHVPPEKRGGVQAHAEGRIMPVKRVQSSHKPAAIHTHESPQPSPVSHHIPDLSPASLPDQTPKTTPTLEVTTKGQDIEAKQQPEVVIKCLGLLARETGIDVKDFTDDASFNEMGIDSLMSLVLSEKLLREVGVEVKSSTFLECPTVGEFTEWLTQYH